MISEIKKYFGLFVTKDKRWNNIKNNDFLLEQIYKITQDEIILISSYEVCYYMMAKYTMNKKYNDALNLLLEFLNISINQEDNDCIYNNIACMYIILGNLDLALEYSLKMENPEKLFQDYHLLYNHGEEIIGEIKKQIYGTEIIPLENLNKENQIQLYKSLQENGINLNVIKSILTQNGNLFLDFKKEEFLYSLKLKHKISFSYSFYRDTHEYNMINDIYQDYGVELYFETSENVRNIWNLNFDILPENIDENIAIIPYLSVYFYRKNNFNKYLELRHKCKIIPKKIKYEFYIFDFLMLLTCLNNKEFNLALFYLENLINDKNLSLFFSKYIDKIINLINGTEEINQDFLDEIKKGKYYLFANISIINY